MLKSVKDLYNQFTKGNTIGKLTTIVILMGFILNINIINYTRNMIHELTYTPEIEKQIDEEYTRMVTPYINTQVNDILLSDPDATNVLLLSYHNNEISSHGLHHLFITTYTEQKRVLNSLRWLWNNEPYAEYVNELNLITLKKYYNTSTSDNPEELKKFKERIELGGSKEAVIYPIISAESGIKYSENSMGMIIVFYDKKKTLRFDYYVKHIAPRVQYLSFLLDYNQRKDEFRKDYYENRQEKWYRLLQRRSSQVLEP